MKWLMVLLSLVGSAFAATIPIELLGVSSTQAVIKYKSTVTTACTLSGAFTVGGDAQTVNDLNATLFTNANSDINRADTLTNGLWRTVLIGKNNSDTASDGKQYSRALPVAAGQFELVSPVTISLSCNGGADTGSIDIHTSNWQVGTTDHRAPPYNVDGFGHWGWPTFNFTDPDAIYIDPMTGLVAKMATRAGGFHSADKQTGAAFEFALDPNSSWTGDQNALNGAGGPYATVSGSTNPLYLLLPEIKPASGNIGSFDPNRTIDDSRINVHGSCDNATAENRIIQVGWSWYNSGNTVNTTVLEATMPQSTPGTVSVPGSFPNPFWASWGAVPRNDWTPRSGTTDYSGNTLTLPASPTYPNPQNRFNVDWVSGTKIYVAGTAATCPSNYCTISSVTSPKVAVIQETLGSATGVAWHESAAALVINKKTTTGSCDVSATWDYVWSSEYLMPVNGNNQLCQQPTVTTSVDRSGGAASARTGYLCRAHPPTNASGPTLLILPDKAEVRIVDDGYKAAGGEAGADDADQIDAASQFFGPRTDSWDLSTGGRYYISATTDGGGQALFQLNFTTDYREEDNAYGDSLDMDFTLANITKSVGGTGWLTTQFNSCLTAKSDPEWDATKWTTFSTTGLSSGYFMSNMGSIAGGQDQLCYWMITDLSTGSYSNCFSSWDTDGARRGVWAGCHSSTVTGLDTWSFTGNPAATHGPRLTTKYRGGPFVSPVDEVLISSVWQTVDTSLSATYAEACESEITSLPEYANLEAAQGSVGDNRCISVRVKQPCNHWPEESTYSEATNNPCPYNASYSWLHDIEVGAFMTDHCANQGVNLDGACSPSGSNEYFLVGKITDIGSDQYELRIVRWALDDNHVGVAATATHNDDWQLTPDVRAPHVYLHVSASTNNSLREHNDFVGHVALGKAADGSSGMTLAGVGHEIRTGDPATTIGQVADFTNTKKIAFNGVSVSFDSMDRTQTYNSKKQDLAPTREQRWFLDFYHLNGPNGVGAEVPWLLYSPACTKEGGTNYTYKCNNPGGTTDRKTFPTWGWAGKYLLREVSASSAHRNWSSSPFGDSDSYSVCRAEVANECRSGSVAGDIYASVPNAGIYEDQCLSATHDFNGICVMQGPGGAGGYIVRRDALKRDGDAPGIQRLTMAFSGPGQQYHFMNARATPDGKFMLFPGMNLNGVRSDTLLGILPPWPLGDDRSTSRKRFLKFRVPVTAVSYANQAQVRFGYPGNGTATDFFCQSRQEDCIAGSTAALFYWADVDTITPVTCSSDCVVEVPVVAGRVFKWRLERLSSGTIVSTGPTQYSVIN